MKNDSHLFPVETPMDSLFDSNKDGKLTGFETTMRDAALCDSERCFNESKADYDPSPKLDFSTSHNNRNSKLQGGYNILLVLVAGFIAVVSPILTIAGLIIDAEYFIKQPEFILTFVVTIIEFIVLFAIVYQSIKQSYKVDLSNCKTDEERRLALDKAKKERKKKFTKLILIIISICVAIGLFAFLSVDLSYRAAVNEVIESEKTVWSFHFNTKLHPDYKDTKGWELYIDVKTLHRDYYEQEFLNYEFKYTNTKQDKAIEELKNEIRKGTNPDYSSYVEGYHELVGTWYCPSYRSCNGGSITITVTQKGNTLYFNRNMIMSTASASSNIDYEVELPINDSFRVDDLHCTYVFDGSSLKEEFDNDRENVLEKESDDDSSSYTTTTKHYYTTTTRHYTTKRYTTKHTTAKYDDPYDVNDYSNEEDFYYDNYDDFMDYYEAEDYYNEYHDE